MENNIIKQQFISLFEDEKHLLSIYSNLSALIKEYFLERANWVGFYFLEDNDLILGPFQGKVACMCLKQYHGVCQKAVELNASLILTNVLTFQNHIACDANSKSELVIPIHKDHKIIGVLDIDSPFYNGFSYDDLTILNEIISLLEEKL